jgi:hypothetical protein
MLERLGSLLADDELEEPRGLFSLNDDEHLRQKRTAAARRWCKDYHKESPKDREPIGSLLVQLGLTEPELYARVFQENSDALQLFERMIVARERGRRKQRKEDRCRRREEQLAEMATARVRRKRGD